MTTSPPEPDEVQPDEIIGTSDTQQRRLERIGRDEHPEPEGLERRLLLRRAGPDRTQQEVDRFGPTPSDPLINPDGPEAAAELKALRERVAELEAAAKMAEYCSNCDCDFCQKCQQDEANRKALAEDLQTRCWSCSCGWLGCYTQAEVAEYEEPSECQKCYRERLVECDPLRVNAALPTARALLTPRERERKI